MKNPPAFEPTGSNAGETLRYAQGDIVFVTMVATQVIHDNGRIAQAAGTGAEYFLGDALGSVRKLTSASGAITYARAYDPYGVVASTTGSSQSSYAFTGESQKIHQIAVGINCSFMVFQNYMPPKRH